MDTQEIQLDKMTLKQISITIPGAVAVLRRYDLDFCCASGNQLLRDVLSPKRVEDILVELESLTQESTMNTEITRVLASDALIENDVTLIDHIITRYHTVHRQQLPELIRLSTRVEKTHAEHPLCPKGLTNHLSDMLTELSTHMQKEEMILFPMLQNGQREMAANPIKMMKSEHDNQCKILASMREITHQGDLPEDACNTWKALYSGLTIFEFDLMQHMHLENNILFNR